MKHLLTISLMLLISASVFSQTLVEGFNSNFGGWTLNTINGFGADKAAFYLSDDAQEGLLSLAESVTSNAWGAGFQYIFSDTLNGQDWSAYQQVSFWLKGDITSLKNVHIELFSAEDKEQWAAPSSDITTDWTQSVTDLNPASFTLATGTGDGALDFAHITKVNFIILNNGDFNEVLVNLDNLQIFGADTVSVQNFNANFGGWAPGTINGFGGDKVGFFLTDDANEGALALRETVASNAWGAGFQMIFSDTLTGEDWSGDAQVAFDAKGDISSLKNVHIELFSSEDKEQWAGPSFELTTDWSTNVTDLDVANFTLATGTGDGALDLTHISKVNFIILNNGDFNTVAVTIDNLRRGTIVGIDPIDDNVAETFSLKQNYPNPFNPSTLIEFNLTDRGNVTLDIFDVTGRTVAQLVNESLQPGSYRVDWNGKDASGNQLSSGIYFYRLQQNQLVQSKRMLLIK